MHVVVWFCLNVYTTLSLSVYVQVDFRTFVHVNAKSMPSSMVKYVSKKYLCVTIGMRNESKMFIRTKHTLWNKYMQGIPAPSAPKFCGKKKHWNVKLTKGITLFMQSQECVRASDLIHFLRAMTKHSGSTNIVTTIVVIIVRNVCSKHIHFDSETNC